ncbi:hypothetical protein BH09BAC1_BH09BAC1_00140 [soil metagenome]
MTDIDYINYQEKGFGLIGKLRTMAKKDDELFEKLHKEHGAEELANSFVFPVDISEEERRASDKELMEVVNKRRANMDPKVRLSGNLLQIRYQIEGYVKEHDFDKKRTIGSFLKAYIDAHHKSQIEFAKEISIQPTVLSQYINNRRIPSESILVRLEIHSNKLITAEHWYELVGKQRYHDLQLNQELRRKQQKFVKNTAQ